jgi:hypothetical protein
MTLTEHDLHTMTVPAWDDVRTAVRAGEVAAAVEHLDVAVDRWRSLQRYSIEWITSLLSFIDDELGEEAVERALRVNHDDFIAARRDTGVDWGGLPAEARAKAIARAMVANFGECEVSEDDEKITLSFRCGSGGRLIDEGRYDEPDGYAVLRQAGPRTFGRDELPVYCAHCSINNERIPLETGGDPVSIEHPPERQGERCVHHVYRDPGAAPAETWVRLGLEPPVSD